MTKRKILKKFITDYKRVIKKLPLTLKKAKLYVVFHNMQHGICYYSWCSLRNIIGEKKWVQKYKSKEDGYWYPTPIDAVTRKQVKDRLELRVKLMKKILKTCK